MAMFARQPFAARRNEKRTFQIRVVGQDLTTVAAAGGLRMQVRLRPNTPGAPLIDLATVTNANAEGLRLSEVTVTNGVPTSTIAGTINKSTMSSSASVPYSGEVGDDSRLAYGVQIDGVTRIVGDFIALASPIDSDDAPTDRPIDFSPQRSAPGQWYTTTLTIAEEEIISITIDGADVVSALTNRSESAATAAETARDVAVASQTDYDSLALAQAGSQDGEFFVYKDAAGLPVYAKNTGGVVSAIDGPWFSAGVIGLDGGGTAQSVIGAGFARTAVNAGLLSLLPNGRIVRLGGHLYEVDSSKIGSDSATTDLGVDGLVPFGPLHVGHFGIDGDGTDETAKLETAAAHAAGKSLTFGDGPYSFSAYPDGLDSVHCVGTPRTSFTGKQIPIFSGVFTGNAEVALCAFVLRYYAADEALDALGRHSAGWYLILDKAGENHDPVLAGPVTASGASSVILDVNLDAFGLDPNKWTPSGCVVGPDETLASDGTVFGASVATTSITIFGSYTGPRVGYIAFDGTNWTLSNAPYTAEWSPTGATGLLRLTRTAKRPAMVGGTNFAPTLQPRDQAAGQNFVASINSVGTDTFDIRFLDLATGARITTPATRLQFYITDPGSTPQPFNFGADPGPGRNVWGVAVFRRLPGGY